MKPLGMAYDPDRCLPLTRNDRDRLQQDVCSRTLEALIRMFISDPDAALKIATSVRNAMAALAALTAVIAAFAGYAQTIYSGKVSKIKDRAFEQYKIDANAEIQNTKVQAENLKAANLALEARVLPRHFSPISPAQLNRLRAYSGRSIRVASYALDVEGALLAYNIIEELSKVGFRVTDNSLSEMPTGVITLGVWVAGVDARFVTAMSDVIRESGITVLNDPRPKGAFSFALNMPSTIADLEIFVAAKPFKK